MNKFSGPILAIVGGLLIFVLVWVLSFPFLIYTKTPHAILVFVLCLFLPFYCWVVGRDSNDSWLGIAILASLPYIVWFSWAFAGLVMENIEHDVVFWNADYSPISFLLYLSVPILSLLAARMASNRTRADSRVLVAAFLFFISLGVYSVLSVDSGIRESSVTVDFLDTPKMTLSAQAHCNYTNYKLYWYFRRVEMGNCACGRIIVQKRSPEVHLSYLLRTVTWNIDGVEEEVQIFPNGDNGIVMDKDGRPDKERNDWSNRKEWNTAIPYKRILNATQVTFTWGDVTQELSDSQRRAFSKIFESYESLK